MSVSAEQKKALDNPSFVCKAEILNRSSGRIVAAGARFDYQDGSTSQKGPIEIAVDPGQSVYFLSDNKCVRMVTVTAAIKFGNQPVQYITGSDNAADQNHCLIGAPFTVVDKKQVTLEKFSSGKSENVVTEFALK